MSGKKTLEVRKWRTSFRGEFLVHASLQSNKKAMRMLGFSTLPTGCIVGRAMLTGVKDYHSLEEFNKDEEKHYAKGYKWNNN